MASAACSVSLMICWAKSASFLPAEASLTSFPRRS